MIPSSPLADLAALDPRLLYVFLAGPGLGETVCVALPPSGWLVVDGCTTTLGELPALAILRAWRRGDAAADPVAAAVLTHPHSDHADGFGELVDGLAPALIAVAGAKPPQPGLYSVLTAARREARTGTSLDRMVAGSVLAAMEAIERWQTSTGVEPLALYDGVQIPAPGTGVDIVSRAPTDAELARFFRAKGRGGRLRRRANEISTVLEIRFGTSCVVLGGDLPYLVPGGRSIAPSGWRSALARHGHLRGHDALKVPHHGSREALHPELVAARTDKTRAWAVTPYNSAQLPGVADMDGLPLMLESEPAVLLTAIPASKAVQARVDGHAARVTIDQLARRTSLQPTGDPFLDEGVDIRPSSAVGPLDAVWCVAVDDHGTIRGRWRGEAALEVVRPAVSVPACVV